jgi:hypothetical protein
MLLVWLLIRWQRVRDDRLLLVLDLVIGIAGMTKFQVMLLCLVLLDDRRLWPAGPAPPPAALDCAPTGTSASRSWRCTGCSSPPRAAPLLLGVDHPLRRRREHRATHRRRVADVGDDMHAFVRTGQLVQWTVLWPDLRTLTVS